MRQDCIAAKKAWENALKAIENEYRDLDKIESLISRKKKEMDDAKNAAENALKRKGSMTLDPKKDKSKVSRILEEINFYQARKEIISTEINDIEKNKYYKSKEIMQMEDASTILKQNVNDICNMFS